MSYIFGKNIRALFESTPVLVSMVVFLILYAILIAYVFRGGKARRRRRWLVLDYVWVPLGGFTGICLVALWWHMQFGP